jgi:catechol 2,3-dioxygenase-like lactoylglutathione lyase family enzyme
VACLELVTIIVDDYDAGISFFVDALGFDLIDDQPSLTDEGAPKRWVVVRPPNGETGILLAVADEQAQHDALGNQTGGRVGFFLNVDDFDAHYERMLAAGVTFDEKPRSEVYGKVAVFRDISGNRWDLLGPA